MQGNKIPGTFRLEHIRAVVSAIAEGVDSANLIGMKTGITTRHVSFAINAADMLGWISTTKGRLKATRAGKALLNKEPGSAKEAAAFERAISNCENVQEIAPDLLLDEAPDFDEMTARIAEQTGLSEASAKRSARVLMSWRRQALLQADDGRPIAPTTPASETSPASAKRRRASKPAAAPTTTEARTTKTPTLRLASLRIEGYGPFEAVGGELRPITVLLGDIGAGKSTFIDAVALVGDALHMGVSRAIEKRARCLDELLHAGRGDSFGIAFELELPDELRPRPQLARARYELVIGRSGRRGIGVQWEWLGLKPAEGRPARVRTGADEAPRGWSPVLGISGARRAWFRAEKTRWSTEYSTTRRRLLLGALPEDPSRFPAALAVRGFFRRGVKRLTIHPSAIREPCSPLASPKLAPSGANLARVVKRLRQSDPARFQRWLGNVRRAIPALTDLDAAQRPEDLHLLLEAHFDEKTPLKLGGRRLSDGTLRFLTLSILPYAGDAWALYVVDDPSLGLGPKSVDALTRCWSDGSSQLLVSTQSPVWARLARLDSLLCVRRNDKGVTEIVPGRRHAGLKRWRSAVERDALLDGYL